MQLRLSALTLRPLAALLILVALLMGSAIDAAACEPEFAQHAQIETSADADGEQNTDGTVEQHGVCAHGHCHHASSMIDHNSDGAAAIATPLDLFRSPQARLAGTAISLPKQPPRA